jgi:hypothetical protein
MTEPAGDIAGDPRPAEERMPLSELLLRLAEDEHQATSVAEIIGHFGPRAFGALIFLFAIPNLLPLPPGSSAVLGLPLLIIAPQLALGARRLHVPGPVGRRRVDGHALAAACRKAAPWLARIERLTTHRLSFMFGRFGEAMIGAVCTLLATVMFLPIPLGNMLPAAAVTALALGLVQRDGLLVIGGYLLSAASGAVLIVSGKLILAAIDRLGAMTGLW